MTSAARERLRVNIPVFLTSAVAWIVLSTYSGGMMLHIHSGSLKMFFGHNPPGTIALSWALMLVAMMLPLLAAPVGHIHSRSFTNRRSRSIVLFMVGYFTVWMIVGAVLVFLAAAMRMATTHPMLTIGLGVIGVSIWEFSPYKQHTLNRGHVHPSHSAFGVAADWDALHFGITHAWWCVGSCWALMLLLMLFPAGHMILMMIVSLWIWGEHLDRPIPPGWHLRFPAKAIRLMAAQVQIFLQRFASPSHLRKLQ
jgi:predicted metal-binding membrane protein